MKHKKMITSVAFFLLALVGLHAQENINAAGGEAVGVGGTSSYTVGQVAYTTSTGADGSVAQGVQQPFEISTTLGIDIITINLELSVYPNPTSDFLTLKVEEVDGLHYQLFDMQGKLIESKAVRNISSSISLENQPTAVYLLEVTKNNKPIKTFKINKN